MKGNQLSFFLAMHSRSVQHIPALQVWPSLGQLLIPLMKSICQVGRLRLFVTSRTIDPVWSICLTNQRTDEQQMPIAWSVLAPPDSSLKYYLVICLGESRGAFLGCIWIAYNPSEKSGLSGYVNIASKVFVLQEWGPHLSLESTWKAKGRAMLLEPQGGRNGWPPAYPKCWANEAPWLKTKANQKKETFTHKWLAPVEWHQRLISGLHIYAHRYAPTHMCTCHMRKHTNTHTKKG